MEVLGYGCIAWLAVAGAAGILEAATCCLVSVWFVLGALAACVLAAVGLPAWAQLAAFLAVSGLTAAALRPLAMRRRRAPEAAEPTMVGKTVTVTASPTPGSRGRAVDETGMDWSIEPALGAALKFKGRCRVVEQRSAVLVVEPLEEDRG